MFITQLMVDMTISISAIVITLLFIYGIANGLNNVYHIIKAFQQR
jgi:hypothetical protein